MNEPSFFGVAGIAWAAVCLALWIAGSGPPLSQTRTSRALLRIGLILVVALPVLMVLSMPSAEQSRADQELADQVWFTSGSDDSR